MDPTLFRNRGIAKLLEGYGRMYCDALEATDIYTKQCSLNVTAKDLAVMGATLADGGVNPLTEERVIDVAHCKRVLAVLATAGLYERSGDWLYEIGLPGKSGSVTARLSCLSGCVLPSTVTSCSTAPSGSVTTCWPPRLERIEIESVASVARSPGLS